MIIALLTDFGTKDYFVGAMKGVISKINENAKIIDVTHEIEPQNINSASFNLRACYKNFPEKTIFVAVVDPGVGSDRRAILIETVDYYFIAPDNGLLSFVFDETQIYCVIEITNEKFFNRPVSKTFHGRDIFAPVAAHLSKGVKPEEFGDEIDDFVILKESQPRKISGNEIEARIIHIDHFGNIVTNFTKQDLPENFYLEINNQRVETMKKFYAEAEKEEVFMIFGSAGFLEIVAFQNSARKILDVRNGDKIKAFVTN